ncbi:FecR family protein [Maribacter sp. 2210JD10-5]|uniref:FecR family protein n=1 Tax=Maribacter sp. 2210JD10-5 TaxID=3386272 RepID=UPI0039BD3CDE
MNKKDLKILIAKYCNNQLTEQEAGILIDWLEIKKNRSFFKQYVQLNFDVQEEKVFEFKEREEIWKEINKRVKQKGKRRNFWKYAAAASILVVVSLSIILTFQNRDSEENIVTDTELKIPIGTDKAILTLENGTDVVLDKKNPYESDYVQSNGKQLVYKNTNESSVVPAYNYLTVPKGGQYSLRLADGTMVWLNSASKLKYPANFSLGETRTVEIVYGEAYFDVSPSTEHNGATFKVITAFQELEVLGTEFNVKAYNDDDTVYTTLVEGKVTVRKDKGAKTVLEPSQQSRVSSDLEVINVTTVDVFNEVSWKEGVFSFEDKPLEEIIIVLSRWYDTEIVITNEKIKKIEFNGVFRKDNELENILEILEYTNNISYEITKGKVSLN